MWESLRDGRIIMDHKRLGNEFPTPRANMEVEREETGIRLEGSAGPIKGKLDVFTSGQARSPTVVAATMLLLVTTACVPAVLLGMIGWLIRVSALPLACAVMGVFVILFATCTLLAFRTGAKPARKADFQPVDIPRPAGQPPSNGSARSRPPKPLPGGNGTKEPPAASRDRRRGAPPR